MADYDEKAEVKKPAPEAKPVEAPKPPTAEEIGKVFEDLVVQAEAAGKRDDPTVAAARALLNRQPKKAEPK